MAIQFNCSGCGNLFRVGDEMAGRKGKCPKCAVINTIPLLDGSMPGAAPVVHQFTAQPVAAPPPPALAAPTNEANFANPDDAAAPVAVRRKKRSKWLIPVLASGLVVLLGACGVLGYFSYGWFFGANINTEQKYMPNGTQFVMSTRVDQFVSCDLYKPIKDNVKGAGEGTIFLDKESEKEFGMPVTEMDRLTVAGSISEEQPTFLIRTKKAVKGADIKSKLAGSYKDSTKINDLIIYENENESGHSFCVVESDLVIYGKFKSLKAIIERGKKAELSESMQAALKKADFSKTMALAINVKEIAGKHDDKSPNPIIEMMAGAGLGKNAPSDSQVEKYSKLIEAVSFSLDLKSDLTMNLQITCKDNVAAEDARKLIDAALVILKHVGELWEIPKEILEDLTTNMKVSTSGSTATATGTIKGPPVVAFIKKMNDKGK